MSRFYDHTDKLMFIRTDDKWRIVCESWVDLFDPMFKKLNREIEGENTNVRRCTMPTGEENGVGIIYMYMIKGSAKNPDELKELCAKGQYWQRRQIEFVRNNLSRF